MKVIDNSENYFPPAKTIGENRLLPYVIVADEAFPLQNHIMKPYPFKSPEPEKKIFNWRLSRARHTVEHAFGILSNRFRVFQTTMKQRVENVQIIVQACCALHNFLMGNTQGYAEVTEENLSTPLMGDEPISRNPVTSNNREILRAAENVRREFSNYFSNEGSVPWQNGKI